MQPVEKEEITLFKSGQIIRMDIIKSVYKKLTSDINPNRNNWILNEVSNASFKMKYKNDFVNLKLFNSEKKLG